MPDVDPSNSYGTPEGPERNTPGIPTEPDAGNARISEPGDDRSPGKAREDEDVDQSQIGSKD